MNKLLIFFCSALILTACNDQCNAPVTPTKPEIEISYIDNDESPADVDNGDDESEKNARMAGTSVTYSFVVENEDMEENYDRLFEVEDWYFPNGIPTTYTPLEAKNTAIYKYRHIKWKGQQFIKIKSLKPGWHTLRLISHYNGQYTITPSVISLEVKPNEKRMIEFDHMSDGIKNVPIEETRLFRTVCAPDFPFYTGTHYMVWVCDNPDGLTLPAFRARYNGNGQTSYMNTTSSQYYRPIQINGKSNTIRFPMTGKLVVWVPGPNDGDDGTILAAKDVDLTIKKGVSIKFNKPSAPAN